MFNPPPHLRLLLVAHFYTYSAQFVATPSDRCRRHYRRAYPIIGRYSAAYYSKLYVELRSRNLALLQYWILFFYYHLKDKYQTRSDKIENKCIGDVEYGFSIHRVPYLSVCVSGKKFKGILLQMRAEGSTTPVGKFKGTRGILANDTKLMKCKADGDTVTHSKPTNKASPTCFYWNAPDNEDPKKSYNFV